MLARYIEAESLYDLTQKYKFIPTKECLLNVVVYGSLRHYYGSSGNDTTAIKKYLLESGVKLEQDDAEEVCKRLAEIHKTIYGSYTFDLSNTGIEYTKDVYDLLVKYKINFDYSIFKDVEGVKEIAELNDKISRCQLKTILNYALKNKILFTTYHFETACKSQYSDVYNAFVAFATGEKYTFHEAELNDHEYFSFAKKNKEKMDVNITKKGVDLLVKNGRLEPLGTISKYLIGKYEDAEKN